MRSLAIAIALLASGCLRTTAFHCASDTQCGAGGTCQDVGYCSFADPMCPDGQRFGDLADKYSNTCVGALPGIDAGIDARPIDAPLFTVGGTVSGLTGSGLVLQNNASGDLTVTASGPFTFAMKLASGSPYNVTVATPPSGQDAYVAHGSGTVNGAPVTSVLVSCYPAGSDPGIRCDTGIFCGSVSQQCCLNKSTLTGTCQGLGATCTPPNAPLACDSANECSGGTGVCCAHFKNGATGLQDASCVGAVGQCMPSGGGSIEILCDPRDTTPCTQGSCTGTSLLGAGYHTCQ